MLCETLKVYAELPGYSIAPRCFYCGKSVLPPMIVWSGSTAFIQFHLECAATFLLAFARDLHEFKQSSGKVLIFDVSPEESQKHFKVYMAEMAEYDRRNVGIQLYNVQLAVPDFQFIDGGSEQVHIQEKGWKQTRCSHYFKQVRVMEARELDSDTVCHHCKKQGGVRIYPTGKFKEYDESTHTWKVKESTHNGS